MYLGSKVEKADFFLMEKSLEKVKEEPFSVLLSALIAP